MSMQSIGSRGDKDALMKTLERFGADPKNINLKANLNEEQQSAEVELLFINRYFMENWGEDFNLGLADVVRDFNETSLSIMGEYHRTTQAMRVMANELKDKEAEESKGLIDKLLGK
jgi:hypothetical protein